VVIPVYLINAIRNHNVALAADLNWQTRGTAYLTFVSKRLLVLIDLGNVVFRSRGETYRGFTSPAMPGAPQNCEAVPMAKLLEPVMTSQAKRHSHECLLVQSVHFLRASFDIALKAPCPIGADRFGTDLLGVSGHEEVCWRPALAKEKPPCSMAYSLDFSCLRRCLIVNAR
jgi:hypothetical protein